MVRSPTTLPNPVRLSDTGSDGPEREMAIPRFDNGGVVRTPSVFLTAYFGVRVESWFVLRPARPFSYPD